MRYYKSPEITTKNHFLVNTIWPVKGSKGNTYSVKMHEKGLLHWRSSVGEQVGLFFVTRRVVVCD